MFVSGWTDELNEITVTGLRSIEQTLFITTYFHIFLNIQLCSLESLLILSVPTLNLHKYPKVPTIWTIFMLLHYVELNIFLLM